jgi:NADPH:quinone reductase-like Zn-dependent oxidoreductase
MKAVVYTQYGSPDVLHLSEVEKPTPKDNEVLIKIYATPVNYGDLLARRLSEVSAREFNMPFLLWVPAKFAIGLRRPKNTILGSQFSGEIETVGKDVTRFKQGDQVFGYRGMSFGANAEYLCMPEDGMLAIKPVNMSHEEAATVPGGGFTALSLLRKVNIQPGQKVLINGASGSIGSHALQLAKYFGAEVTGVCGTPRVEMVKALGADKVIDYTKEDFTQSGETYDLIFDVFGKSMSSGWKRVLKPNGRYLFASFKMRHLFHMIWTSRFGSKKVICALSNEIPEDLNFVKELVESGKIKTVIDRCYPLEQTADAHRYMEAGHKTGNVIIMVAHPN